jgi:predicted transcriptional regulator
MNDSKHLLISLEERHAVNIFAGTKRVELRRREMHVEPGSTVWLYVKMPVGCVTGYAIVDKTHTMSPVQLWQRFGTCSGLEKAEFFNYFVGVRKAFALALRDATVLPAPVPLSVLRKASIGFQPPQFFSRIETGGPLLKAMTTVKRRDLSDVHGQTLSPPSLAAAYA